MNVINQGLSVIMQELLGALPRFLIGMVILSVGAYLIRVILRILRNRLEKRDVEKSLRGFLVSLVKFCLYIILLLTVVGTMGFNIAGFAAIFASAGVAIGLALQGSLSNFAGGILILLFKPFKVGDYISNSSNTEGTVEQIDLLYTTLLTATGLRVFSPNGTLANSVITNYSEIVSRRHDFIVSISYSEDIERAKTVLCDALSKHPAILKDPAVFVFVNKLNESGVDLNVRTWMGKADYWDTVYQVQQLAKQALEQANVEIPFNQLDVNIVNK